MFYSFVAEVCPEDLLSICLSVSGHGAAPGPERYAEAGRAAGSELWEKRRHASPSSRQVLTYSEGGVSPLSTL